MRPITDYLISHAKRKEFQDSDKMIEYLSHQQTLQTASGLSDDILMGMYEVAVGLFELKRYPESIDAFIFLTTINPNVGSFWLGLGSALEMELCLDGALAAYKTAISKDPERMDGYLYAVRCCIQLKDFKEGQRICELASGFAKDRSKKEQLAKLVKDIRKMKRYAELKRKSED